MTLHVMGLTDSTGVPVARVSPDGIVWPIYTGLSSMLFAGRLVATTTDCAHLRANGSLKEMPLELMTQSHTSEQLYLSVPYDVGAAAPNKLIGLSRHQLGDGSFGTPRNGRTYYSVTVLEMPTIAVDLAHVAYTTAYKFEAAAKKDLQRQLDKHTTHAIVKSIRPDLLDNVDAIVTSALEEFNNRSHEAVAHLESDPASISNADFAKLFADYLRRQPTR